MPADLTNIRKALSELVRNPAGLKCLRNGAIEYGKRLAEAGTHGVYITKRINIKDINKKEINKVDAKIRLDRDSVDMIRDLTERGPQDPVEARALLGAIHDTSDPVPAIKVAPPEWAIELQCFPGEERGFEWLMHGMWRILTGEVKRPGLTDAAADLLPAYLEKIEGNLRAKAAEQMAREAAKAGRKMGVPHTADVLPPFLTRLGQRVREEILRPYNALERFRSKFGQYCYSEPPRKKGRQAKGFWADPCPETLDEAYVLFALIHDAACPGEDKCAAPEWTIEGESVYQNADMAGKRARCARFALRLSDLALIEPGREDALCAWFEKVKKDCAENTLAGLEAPAKDTGQGPSATANAPATLWQAFIQWLWRRPLWLKLMTVAVIIIGFLLSYFWATLPDKPKENVLNWIIQWFK